jgi:hypothetical protein
LGVGVVIGCEDENSLARNRDDSFKAEYDFLEPTPKFVENRVGDNQYFVRD